MVYGQPVPKALDDLLRNAAAVRDSVMHGKTPSDAKVRNAIGAVLDYAKALNECVANHGGAKPFGDLRGFSGQAKKLEKGTSRWLLKDMGFPLK